jgi:hypothetical protein
VSRPAPCGHEMMRTQCDVVKWLCRVALLIEALYAVAMVYCVEREVWLNPNIGILQSIQHSFWLSGLLIAWGGSIAAAIWALAAAALTTLAAWVPFAIERAFPDAD